MNRLAGVAALGGVERGSAHEEHRVVAGRELLRLALERIRLDGIDTGGVSLGFVFCTAAVVLFVLGVLNNGLDHVQIDPFLLLDEMGPTELEPGQAAGQPGNFNLAVAQLIKHDLSIVPGAVDVHVQQLAGAPRIVVDEQGLRTQRFAEAKQRLGGTLAAELRRDHPRADDEAPTPEA